MKNLLLNLKPVQAGSYKAEVGAGAKTFWKSEPELEPKQIVLSPQLCSKDCRPRLSSDISGMVR
jgi:hypothetical protein